MRETVCLWLLIVFFTFALAPRCVSQSQPGMPPEKVAVVFDQNIHYYEAGDGPVIILLHGLGANAGIWNQNIGPLSAKYHVYALDQIGFGHSDKPLLDYKIATFVDFLQEFMQSQHITKAALVGNSLGGWIAIEFTVHHPEMVDKVVLVNSAGLPFGRLTIDLNPSSIEATRVLMKSLFYNKEMVTEDLVGLVFTQHLKNNDGYTIQRTLAGFSSPDQFETPEKMRQIHVPTLIIWGHDDELLPLAMGEQFHNSIASSKIVIIPQCGHIPEVEKPAEFDQALMGFLGQR